MSRSVVPEILQRLEPWLDERSRQWSAQSGAARDRAPTLPMTPDGKVNVRGIVQALGLPIHHEQHFFRHLELRAAVNTVSETQGLKPIGARGSADDSATAGRLKLIEQRSSELDKLVSEQAATIEWQRKQIASLREQLRILEETGQPLRLGDLP